MAQERLQKILARAGLASRRGAENLITSGRVRVNGKLVTELGVKADSYRDRIVVDGNRIEAEKLVYLVLNKPRGCVSTLSDPQGRPTVADLVKDVPQRLFPVGRLDFATSGVLLMTNDGNFSNALLHPSSNVPKTYVLKCAGVMPPEVIDAWREGVELDDGKTLPAEVVRLRYEGDKTWLRVTVREGRNHLLRRMGEATGFHVMRLSRLEFAGIDAEHLKPGVWRPLSVDEQRKLKKTHGVPSRVRAQQGLFGLLKRKKPVRQRPTRGKRAPASADQESTEAGDKGPSRRRRSDKAKTRRKPR
ncbi:MAG: pseudouridine synthase [Polyangiaceae bacterium]